MYNTYRYKCTLYLLKVYKGIAIPHKIWYRRVKEKGFYFSFRQKICYICARTLLKLFSILYTLKILVVYRYHLTRRFFYQTALIPKKIFYIIFSQNKTTFRYYKKLYFLILSLKFLSFLLITYLILYSNEEYFFA